MTRPVRAFVVTDVEGSTRTLRELGAGYQVLLQQHRDLLTSAYRDCGMLGLRTEGDAIIAAFPTVDDAITAAVAAQRALAAHAWEGGRGLSIRMGVHAGEVDEADDLMGPGVTEANAVCTPAHGGQIVISDEALTSGRNALRDGIDVVDLGSHKLKGIEGQRHLWQLTHPQLRADFAPLSSAHVHLPAVATTFVGRDAEITQIWDGLRSNTASVVTCVGSGGTGKTRLAVEAARHAASAFADGVWFVDLTALRDPLLVGNAIAQTLELRETPGKPVVDSIRDQLQGKAALIVLDGFQQVAGFARRIPEMMARSPRSRLLITARAATGVPGEQLVDVQPLSTDAGSGTSVAAALFRDRAALANPGIVVDAAAARAIEELCSRLAGLPLAIELVAARVQVLTPAEILSRLENRAVDVTTASRDHAAQQRSLSGIIEWTCELLAPEEREVLAALGVFTGDFDAAAAAAVSAEWHATEVTDVALGSLTSKNLVLRDVASDRYSLAVAVGEYALGRLDTMGLAASVRRRHATHFAALLAARRDDLHGPAQQAAVLSLDLERDNFRAAMTHAIDSGERQLGVTLLVTLAWYWSVRGDLQEARLWADRILGYGRGADVSLRCEALAAAGRVKLLQGDIPGMNRSARAIRALLPRARHRRRWLGWAELFAAVAMLPHKRRARFRARWAAWLLRRTPEPWERGVALTVVAEIDRIAGRRRASLRRYVEAEALFAAADDPFLQTLADVNLGPLYFETGSRDQGIHHMIQALTRAEALRNELFTGYALVGLGCVAAERGDEETATLLLGAANHCLGEQGAEVGLSEIDMLKKIYPRLIAKFGESGFREVFARGNKLTPAEAVRRFPGVADSGLPVENT